MHIPDSFLSPATCAGAFIVAMPVLYLSAKRTLRDHGAGTASLIAACSAFAFVIQMFNVPLPFGGTGHVVGAAALACLYGPWVAIFSVSIALAVQALMFGDGGIMSYGANVLDMAIVQSIVAYAVFGFMARVWESVMIRTAVATLLAVVCGGLVTVTLLGVQTTLHVDNNGVSMYFPFSLKQSFAGLMVPQSLIGMVEAVFTAALVVSVLKIASRGGQMREVLNLKPASKVWVAIAVGIMLVPLGVLLPAFTNAGDAWGEWGAGEVTEMAELPYTPSGMARVENWYPAPVPDYGFTGAEQLPRQSFEYILAAILGVGIIILLAFILNRRFTRSVRLKSLKE